MNSLNHRILDFLHICTPYYVPHRSRYKLQDWSELWRILHVTNLSPFLSILENWNVFLLLNFLLSKLEVFSCHKLCCLLLVVLIVWFKKWQIFCTSILSFYRKCKMQIFYSRKFVNILWSVRPYFSENTTFKNPLKTHRVLFSYSNIAIYLRN